MKPQLVVPSEKDSLRWELADVSDRLNRLLKQATIFGPLVPNDSILELRAKRDELLMRLNQHVV